MHDLYYATKPSERWSAEFFTVSIRSLRTYVKRNLPQLWEAQYPQWGKLIVFHYISSQNAIYCHGRHTIHHGLPIRGKRVTLGSDFQGDALAKARASP